MAALTGVLDGSKRTAVLAFFIEIAKNHTTSLLDTLFSHLREIQTQGLATTIPELGFVSFESMANGQSY